MTIDHYIEQVRRALPRTLPSREPILTELRGHIDDRLSSGMPLDQVLEQLGPPEVLAQGYAEGAPPSVAPYGARALAKVLDALMVIGVALVVALIAWLLVPTEAVVVPVLVGLFAGAFGFPLYTIVAEWRHGQTFGKRRVGLLVVREDGLPLGLGAATVRQLGLLLQVFWIDALFALFTARRQRAFELLSRTWVVQLPPSR